MKRRALVAGLVAIGIASGAGGAPTRVSDFEQRAASWKHLAIAPLDCSGTTLSCGEVAGEVFKWARASWGPQVISAEAFNQAMLDKGIESLGTQEARATALASIGADALLVVKIVQVTSPPRGTGRADAEASIEARIYTPDREAPVAVGQEARGAFSEWGAVQRVVRLLLTELFKKGDR